MTVDGLDVTVTGGVRAVRGVSFTVGRGEAVGLVGESGSGKSLTCRSALGVLPAGCEVSGGRIVLGGEDGGTDAGSGAGLSEASGSGGEPVTVGPGAELTAFTRKQWDAVRGRRIGAVFQDPASYLNP
ncbi:ATP-binding cassette domain-containing protein, partial [Streptomyces sp. NPDC001840]